MNFLEKLNTSRKFLQAVVFKKRSPLSISWNITYRCNLKCGYCGAWEKKVKELSTKKVFAIIDEFINMGTKFIKFSGGEPLLREDLGQIIDFCKRKKLYVLLNSNGTLVKKEQEKLKGVKEIQLSLDGPPQINDAIRGRGVHDKVIEAVKICKDRNISVMLTTVISKYNISHIPYILDIAKEYKIGVQFQPADQIFSYRDNKNINFLFSPKEEDYRKVISFLLEEKSKGNKFIYNSISGLKHIYHWPKPQKINCLLSLLRCHIEPDGRIFVCNDFRNYQKYLVSVDVSYKESFDKLSLPYPCKECWCSDIEYNMCESFKLDSLLDMWKRFSSK